MSFLNLTDVAMSGGDYELIPEGVYEGKVTNAELKETKSGGKMVVLEFTTEKGKLWENFNIVNSNPKAEEIGKGKLKTLLVYAGRSPDVQNINDFCGVPFKIAISIFDDNGTKRNKIKSFRKVISDEATW
jgi:hypothetical protein